MLLFSQKIIENIAILFFATLIYSYIIRYISHKFPVLQKILLGFVFGFTAVYGMLDPYVYSPGVFFNAGSIVICAAGIFSGFLGALIAASISILYHICIGGIGENMGIAIIIYSAVFGYCWGILRDKNRIFKKYFFTFLFSVLLQIGMCFSLLFLPVKERADVFCNILFPMILLLPLALLFLIVIINNQKRVFNQEIKLLKAQAELKFNLLQTLTVISKALEFKDEYTKNHQLKVANLSVRIALQLNWDKNKLIGLYIASLLHDIGKISIPVNILNKKKKLTDSEFEVIKTHPVVGHKLLSEIEFPWPIDKIILQHHERIDGSGYPNHLSGNEILEEAKIIAVSDTVEAIINKRPYRKALGLDYALKTIEIEKGKTLDHKISTICLDLLSKYKSEIFELPKGFNKIFYKYYNGTDKSNLDKLFL